jgi:hypothetical protein
MMLDDRLPESNYAYCGLESQRIVQKYTERLTDSKLGSHCPYRTSRLTTVFFAATVKYHGDARQSSPLAQLVHQSTRVKTI